MRTLGILGGMAWPSTAEAYRLINEEVQARLGGVHSAPLIVWSFDFAEIEQLQTSDDWDAAGQMLAAAARRLEDAGAEGLMLCTNTMHLVADAIEDATTIPLLHIADATAQAINADGPSTVGLLGTAFTMERDFYRGRLEQHGLEVVVPGREDREFVHRVIYDELVHGRVVDHSRGRYLEIIGRLADRGAEGIIAGCTEIELLVTPDHIDLPYYPTTRIHTMAAVDWILERAPSSTT
ncbi:MAG: aspartate/glutamate racemase family protein [Nitriliruptorales bacterium]|nr:aspartate/glutamate racemase family protein [Nitriliruptorales bacterium]